jgi:DNA polymerase-1
VYDIKNDQVTCTEDLVRDMGMTPEQFIDCLALQGDTSDNIPGVPDVGPKTALGWIQTYGTLENLLEHAHDIKGKRGERLRASRDILALSRELVTIHCDIPLDIDFEHMALQPPDHQGLTVIFNELGFNRLISQLGLSTTGPDISTPPSSSTTDTPDSAESVACHYTLVDTDKALDDLLEQLKSQNAFAIDTETTSILPMRAELVGVSVAWQAHRAYYLPLKSPLGTQTLNKQRVQGLLGPVLADDRIKKVGQNIKYDMLVLERAGMPLEGIYFDTMVASYCLDPARRSHSLDNLALDLLNYQCIPIEDLIGKGKNQRTFDMVETSLACRYAAEDADITWQLYEHLRAQLDGKPHIKSLFEDVEMPLVPVLAAMEKNGVSLDIGVLKGLSGRIAETLEQVTEQIYTHADETFNVDSPKQLAGILFDKLGLTSVRKGKTGRSTDAGVLEQLTDQHPIIELILQYRQLSKLQNTYVDKLGSLIHPGTGRVHTSFNQTVTATGRLSSSDPNLQNIPIRTELGRQIRSAFVAARDTDCILRADYSQIELRLLAHFSRDPALVEAFAADQDIHRFVASQIYGVALEDVTSVMRSSCKAVNFGIIYGQGAFGLSRTTGMSITEAKRFIQDYYARYQGIQTFMDNVVARAEKNGYVETILRRHRRIQNINSRNANKRSQARRFAVNTVIQGSAADLIKVAMIHVHRHIQGQALPVKMILQVHDELVFELPTDQVQQHVPWIKHAMEQALSLSVPLKVDIHYGPSWLEKS